MLDWPKLVLKFLAPDRFPSGPVSKRIPRLQHELLDDPMKDDPVVIPIPRMRNEILDRFWSLFGVESEMNVAFGGMDDGSVGGGGDGGGEGSGHCHGLFFSCRFLVEDVSIFGVSVMVFEQVSSIPYTELISSSRNGTSCMTHSGSLLVKT